MPHSGQRGLNHMESRLIFDLYNLGMTKEEIGKFFNISTPTITAHLTKQRQKRGEPEYSTKEMSDVMVRFTLTSLARHLHRLTVEQQLRFLPDLLKIQAETNESDEGDSFKTHIYFPQKPEEDQKPSEDDADDIATAQ